jgi:hypothetical protein
MSARIKNSRCSQAAAPHSLAGSIGIELRWLAHTLEQLMTVQGHGDGQLTVEVTLLPVSYLW